MLSETVRCEPVPYPRCADAPPPRDVFAAAACRRWAARARPADDSDRIRTTPRLCPLPGPHNAPRSRRHTRTEDARQRRLRPRPDIAFAARGLPRSVRVVRSLHAAAARRDHGCGPAPPQALGPARRHAAVGPRNGGAQTGAPNAVISSHGPVSDPNVIAGSSA